MKKLLYQNPLASPADIAGFRLEGQAQASFDAGVMEMKNSLDPSLGQKANFVLWCPEEFPGDIEISWQFSPVKEPGLCIMFFAARGLGGQDLFAQALQKRDGEYHQYHSGDINCYHVAYFRRMWEDERCFHTCNLRKSKGFHLVCQGGDPLPNVEDSKGFYHIKIAKKDRNIRFYIDDLLIFDYMDDGSLGDVLGGGKIGFRQMAPLVGRYRDLKVYEI